MYHVATTPQLTDLLTDGTEKGYNRAFEASYLPKFLSALDPDGKHLVKVILIHEHINGEKADPHYRTWVYAKLNGQEEAHQFVTDFTIEKMEGLELIYENEVEANVAESTLDNAVGAGKSETVATIYAQAHTPEGAE